MRPKTMMIIALAALALGMAGLAEARGWLLMTVYIVGVGIGFGLSFIASTMMLFNYYGKRPNLELYSIMCMLSTSAAIGPAIGGWARDTLGSFTQMFIACAVVTVLMLIATVLMRQPTLDRAPVGEPVGEPGL
jgi:MFS family permease